MGNDVTSVGKTEKKELKKHAAAIHCSNTLSLLQRKISNALLYHAYPELLSREEHEINMKQLCHLIMYQGHNYAALKDALKGLISTVIEWNLIDDETGLEDWTASSIIASVSLKGPICYYAYSPRMKQLLHSPSMFGKINLFVQSHFKSSYGLALYENCTRYRGLPQTKWIEIDLFRRIMGVPEGKYEIFRDFKRRVLDKSIEEVNMYSDLLVESEYIREGRRVTRIRFHLKDRTKKSRLGKIEQEAPQLKDSTSEITEILNLNYGFSTEQIQSLLASYSEHYILEKIKVIEASKNYQEGNVHNLSGYLMSALKNDYQPARKVQSKILGISRRNAITEDRTIKMIQKEYAAYREAKIDSAIQTLSDSERQHFIAAFYHFAASAIQTVLNVQVGRYTRETVLQSPQIKSLLRQYACRELAALHLLSIDEFVTHLSLEKREAWERSKNNEKRASVPV